jgi:hypothetical protein
MSARSLVRRSTCGRGHWPGRVSGAVLIALLFFVLPAAANAYTLVLRSGRQVTVPGAFRVTPSAVVYEASPGFSITVWLSNVDFAATERANAEPAGSFAKRIGRDTEGAGAAQAPEASKAGRRPGRKVVTDKDLEPSRLRREAQEEEYERTRRERGMPSKEELQRRVEEQDRELREWARQMEAERTEAELESLRSELANVRMRLGELNLRLSQQAATYGAWYAPPNYYPYSYAPLSYYPYSYAPPFQVIAVVPFGHHRGRFGHGQVGPNPHVWPHNPWPGHAFPPVIGQPRHFGAPLRAPALAPRAAGYRR